MKMRNFGFFLVVALFFSCTEVVKKTPFTEVELETLYTDSLSIRAIELMGNSLAFAANKGTFGTIDINTGKVRVNVQRYDSILPEFRAVAHTNTDFFMLSVANPALLYKTGNQGTMELVYKEDAAAASNTNIAVVGNNTWVATTKRILYSPDKGRSWTVQNTPISSKEPTEGIYSIDFYNENEGVAMGGDYTNPERNTSNKAMTTDGGLTWELIADGRVPNYRSCIQFVPGTEGKGMVALGFTGIAYSANQGASWTQLSDESFFTVRFKNDSVAYAAGRNRIAKLTFK